jgi:hypothetical protein
MGHAEPGRGQDDQWDADERHETPLERLDRNWQDLLQELRVAQTGVQLLTGFLLTLPFQSTFQSLTRIQHDTYLATVSCAISSTGCLIAPVSLHRILFRRHLRRRMVTVSHHLALVGLSLLACSVTGVVMLMFSVVSGQTAGFIAAAITALLLASLWATLPLALRRGAPVVDDA